ncbi:MULTISPECIES: phosphoketolase [unclassified Curtobacterium]|uniref:phosphoketolase family protein n=1 Tax=unclassified Curtobacterium TaxID=257496 RepID=UPI0008DD2D07|nr:MULTISPECIES: phosphoketolase family protein [unclassified Curtobacterium]OIH99880.1 phosphoketolase [Curtobacterium sp. MCBA15_003]OII14423.1 phosphoketolase [Curtobacterium sp. MCBA15_009]OII32706.1 phosphoketolase [Curtobacterium sp. MMLR14_006]
MAAAHIHSTDRLRAIDAWWRAANYLTVGQIYLLDNPMLERPIEPSDVKPRLLGHWGTSPALNLVYAHCNAVIADTGRQFLYVCGPGHGGPAMNANAWLDGTWGELYPDHDLQRFFRQFSFPGGIPSHAAPETPGSINEGGELGYSLAHAYGAALDNPDLVVACVVGDGEAETGPLAASWQAHTFLDPVSDGAVLPILNLNGWKIANPTVLARIPEADLTAYFRGLGYEPLVVDSRRVDDDPFAVHALFEGALRRALASIDDIQAAARAQAERAAAGQPAGAADLRPRWPMIVLRTPKGWTGPKEVDGERVEGTFRAHQVPLPAVREDDAHRAQLEEWMRSYRADELLDDAGHPTGILTSIRPTGETRMSATPHANGGRIRTALDRPSLEPYGVEAGSTASATGTLGPWVAELISRNASSFRLFGPDETISNKLDAVFDVTSRVWRAQRSPDDEHLSARGRVTEVLSEHLLEGMLEGYVLSGRHGILNTYEAFAHIIDSMVGQYAKWLESATDIDWRAPVSNLSILLSSHVWRQDHNGFSHQDPGFLDVVASKQQDLVRIKLPADANTLLAVAAHAMETTDRIEVIVAGKHPEPVFLSLDDAVAHAAAGLGVWDWAGTEQTVGRVDVVMACAGDVPTVEAIAAVDIIRRHAPGVGVRVVNVVDLLALGDPRKHEHPIPDDRYDKLFLPGTPAVFAFHGYPSLVHQLTYRRNGHDDLHVHGFLERGTTTSPFDMLMRNEMDRFALAHDALTRVDADAHADLLATLTDAREAARTHAYTKGEDHPSVDGWEFSGWPQDEPASGGTGGDPGEGETESAAPGN